MWPNLQSSADFNFVKSVRIRSYSGSHLPYSVRMRENQHILSSVGHIYWRNPSQKTFGFYLSKHAADLNFRPGIPVYKRSVLFSDIIT